MTGHFVLFNIAAFMYYGISCVCVGALYVKIGV